MRVDLFGLVMDAPGVTFYLWSPWRCSVLETRLFEAVKSVAGAKFEKEPDEQRVHVEDPKGWKQAVTNLSRVLKGWQEEAADAGRDEKRTWRWLLEADVDANGYDAQGEKASMWAYLRLGLDRGGPADAEKGEDVDMNGFGLCVWGQQG